MSLLISVAVTLQTMLIEVSLVGWFIQLPVAGCIYLANHERVVKQHKRH